MANRKVTPNEDYNYLPKRVQESTKLSQGEKNVLATLCYERLSHRDYAEGHEGWFYCSQQDLIEGTMFSKAQLNRKLLDIEIKGIIQRKSGTNHRCTHYKLHPKIDELLPKIESDSNNETLLESHYVVNMPLETQAKIANETLDKIRIDKTRLEKDSLIVSVTNKENDDFAETLEGSFSQSSFDVDEFYKRWYVVFKECNSFEELKQAQERFKEEYQGGLTKEKRENLVNRINLTELKLKSKRK